MAEIKGIVPPTVTPFIKGTNEVDIPTVRDHTEFLIERGIHGVFVSGTTGEGLLLDPAEHRKLVQAVVDQSRKRIAVLAHVGAIDTSRVLNLIEGIKDLGVDAFTAAAPFYYKYDEDCLLSFYSDISRASGDTQFFVYNNPFTTGHNISPELACKIAERCPNFAGIKDSSESIIQISTYCAKLPHKCFLVGTTAMILPSLSVGARGAVPGMANCLPELLVGLWDTFFQGDLQAAREKQHYINQITARFKVGPSIPVYKFILKLRGFNFEYSLPPQRELTEGEKTRIREVFEEVRPQLTK